MLTGIDKYIHISFYLETPAYYHHDRPYNYALGFDTEKESNAFYAEMEEKFQKYGWEKDKSGDMIKGKSNLYIHPQQLLGEIKEELIPEVLEILQKTNTCSLRFFDRIEDQFDYTNEFAKTYILTKIPEIEEYFSKACKTRTRRHFVHFENYNLFEIAKHFLPLPLDEKAPWGAVPILQDILAEMAAKGILVSAEINGKTCYRTKFKTEKQHTY